MNNKMILMRFKFKMLPLVIIVICLVSSFIQFTEAKPSVSTNPQQLKKKSEAIADQSVPFAAIARSHRRSHTSIHHKHHRQGLLSHFVGNILFPDTHSYRKHHLSTSKFGPTNSNYRKRFGRTTNFHRTLKVHTPRGSINLIHHSSHRRHKH